MSIVAYDGSFTMIGRPLMVMPFSSAASRAGHRHAIVIWAVAGNVDDAPQPAIGILFEQRRRQRSEAFVFLRRPRNASDDRAHFFPLRERGPFISMPELSCAPSGRSHNRGGGGSATSRSASAKLRLASRFRDSQLRNSVRIPFATCG